MSPVVVWIVCVALAAVIQRSAGALAVLGVFLCGAAARDGNEFRNYGPFALQSNGEGQLSNSLYSISVRTAGKLAVSYTAPRAHCASLRLHLWVDGKERAVTGEVPPGHRTGFVDLGPVTPGNHVISLQAEGVLGGCDTGKLTAWSGSAEVWTQLLPGDHSLLRANELGDVLLEVEYLHYGSPFVSRGTYVKSDGQVFSYEFGTDSTPWNPTPSADGDYDEADLLEKFGHGRRLLGRVADADWDAILHSAFHLSSQTMPVVPPRATGTDVGITSYRVYRRRPANGDYEMALIAESGDLVWNNPSADAIKLRAWLDRILQKDAYKPVAEPHTTVCVTFPCDPPQ